MVSNTIFNDFFKSLASSGEGKKWFTKIYTFFLCGLPYPTYIYIQYSYSPLLSPLNDFHLFRRNDLIKKFKDNDEYTTAVLNKDQFNLMNIGNSDINYKNLSSGLELNKDISSIIKQKITFNNINKALKYKYTGVKISGYLYQLKPFIHQKYLITKKEQQLVAKQKLEDNNTKLIYNMTRSGILIKDKYGNYLNITLPKSNITKYTSTDIVTKKYESGLLIYNKNNDIETYSANNNIKSELETYFNTIKHLLPQNAIDVIICENIYFGEYRTLGDEIFNNDAIIINNIINREEALIEDHPILNEYINYQYNSNEINRALINIIYQINNNLLSIEQINSLFNIYPIVVNIDINDKKLIGIENNKLCMFSNNIYQNTLLLPYDIHAIKDGKSKKNIDGEVYINWLDNVKERLINAESVKNYEVR